MALVILGSEKLRVFAAGEVIHGLLDHFLLCDLAAFLPLLSADQTDQ